MKFLNNKRIEESTPLPMGPALPGQFASIFVVPKDGSVSLRTPTMPRELSSAEQEQIRANRVFLFIYGTVDYEDVFGEHRETSFCRVYDAPSESVVPCSAKNWMN